MHQFRQFFSCAFICFSCFSANLRQYLITLKSSNCLCCMCSYTNKSSLRLCLVRQQIATKFGEQRRSDRFLLGIKTLLKIQSKRLSSFRRSVCKYFRVCQSGECYAEMITMPDCAPLTRALYPMTESFSTITIFELHNMSPHTARENA